MGKLRHIALSVKDVPAAKKFFEQAFDMEAVGESKTGTVYLTDGTMNIALLGRKGRPLGYEGDAPFYGIDHFGIWVDDVDEACKKLEAAGATHVMGNKSGDADSFYEIKYRDPQGQLFDITANGWKGAVKDVVPAEDATARKPAKVG